MRHLLLSFLVLIPGALWAQAACDGESGGWRTRCLRDQAQISDEDSTRTYWELRNKISALPSSVGPKDYAKQLNMLLKKNELDYITYTESYCNMQVVLATAETEINRILSCQIHTANVRNQELKSIIESIDSRQAGQ